MVYDVSQLVYHKAFNNDVKLTFSLTFHHSGTYFRANSVVRPSTLDGDQMIRFLHGINKRVFVKRTDTAKIDNLRKRWKVSSLLIISCRHS